MANVQLDLREHFRAADGDARAEAVRALLREYLAFAARQAAQN